MAELLVEYKDEAEKSAHPALKGNKLSTQSWLVLRNITLHIVKMCLCDWFNKELNG